MGVPMFVLLFFAGVVVILVGATWLEASTIHADLHRLAEYLAKGSRITMTNLQDIKDQVARTNDALTNIAADIQRLTEQIPADGAISAADALQLKVDLTALADRAATVAAVTPEPDGAAPEPTPEADGGQ